MNTKKTILALATVALFAFTSCTSTSASDDAIYEDESIDRTKIKIHTNGIDRTKIKIHTNG
ncbi:MAG: peptidase m28 [Cellulophaga sp.]|nr:peptidase m28 [Cellulophaga sp.]